MISEKIFSAREVSLIASSLRSKQGPDAQKNLIIFRLATCCGLRVSEIGKLEIRDIVTGGERPVVNLRKEIVKGKRVSRSVPLRWSTESLKDIRKFHDSRKREAEPTDMLLLSNRGNPLNRSMIAKRFKTAISVLGEDRKGQVSIHRGRHTFLSHALDSGRSLPVVRDVAGHSSVTVTEVYLHAIEDETLGDIYEKRSRRN